MSNHTPGPWEFAHHGTTPQNTSVEVQTENGLPVAVMSYCGSAEANARLIAAAPDLFGACKLCVARLEEYGDAESGIALELARTAIAKATNES